MKTDFKFKERGKKGRVKIERPEELTSAAADPRQETNQENGDHNGLLSGGSTR